MKVGSLSIHQIRPGLLVKSIKSELLGVVQYIDFDEDASVYCQFDNLSYLSSWHGTDCEVAVYLDGEGKPAYDVTRVSAQNRKFHEKSAANYVAFHYAHMNDPDYTLFNVEVNLSNLTTEEKALVLVDAVAKVNAKRYAKLV